VLNQKKIKKIQRENNGTGLPPTYPPTHLPTYLVSIYTYIPNHQFNASPSLSSNGITSEERDREKRREETSKKREFFLKSFFCY